SDRPITAVLMGSHTEKASVPVLCDIHELLTVVRCAAVEFILLILVMNAFSQVFAALLTCTGGQRLPQLALQRANQLPSIRAGPLTVIVPVRSPHTLQMVSELE